MQLLSLAVTYVLRPTVLLLVAIGTASMARGLHRPAEVDEYKIHEDGGIIYNPLSREARKTGQLAKYDSCSKSKQTLVTDRYRVEFRVPEKATAYDVLPIDYRMTWQGAGVFPVGVEAVCFEDDSLGGNKNFHDLALPGEIALKMEYLGSITADIDPEMKHNITADFSDTPREYPNFHRKPMVRSGVVEAGDIVWFKFKYTNTGNTILDSEGVGASQFYPLLLKKDESGEYRECARAYNLYYRFDDYFYPGQSDEVWMNFRTSAPGASSEYYRLEAGEYKIQTRLTYRCYLTKDAAINYWDGPVVYNWEIPITVAEEAEQAPVGEGVEILPGNNDSKLPTFLHSYEEFMTAYDLHLKGPEGGQKQIEGTLYLQVAPWTKNVVLKLVGSDPVSVKCLTVPVDVDSGSLEIKYNPDARNSIVKNGLKEPVFMSQTMADMRTNVQHSPFPEHHIRNRLRVMMECGVNVIATTSMPWMYQDIKGLDYNYAGDAWKYALDVARSEGLAVEGWGQYPFNRGTIKNIANWIVGRDQFSKMDSIMSAYGGNAGFICYNDRQLAAANAEVIFYHFYRWGDLFYQSGSGSVPISVGEDTRGWMRDDVNTRFPIGEKAVREFQRWVERKYKTIDAVNKVWNSNFGDFSEIDPETGVIGPYGHRWNYTDQSMIFHDWNQAVEDYDIWRTLVRIGNYHDTLKILHEKIPTADIILRTEGGNVLVAGIDPESPNAHYRHVYYSQRRLGAVGEVLLEARPSAIGYHSDYTTIPYTPSELVELTRMSVKQGIIPVYLPYFNDMRDVAINDRYGLPYEVHYNLPEPKKGYMTHVLVACYPWFKIMQEEGGVPGVLWEDYQCAGFVTATQRKEMRFYQSKLREALNTPEAVRARSKNINQPERWRDPTKAMRSYYGFDQE